MLPSDGTSRMFTGGYHMALTHLCLQVCPVSSAMDFTDSNFLCCLLTAALLVLSTEQRKEKKHTKVKTSNFVCFLGRKI